MKKIIAALLSITMILSAFAITAFSAETYNGEIVKTVANSDITITANSSNVTKNSDNYLLSAINSANTAATLQISVNVENAGYYDLSSNLSFTDFGDYDTTVYHYFYGMVKVTSGTNIKNYTNGTLSFSNYSIRNVENDKVNTRYDKAFVAPIYLESGYNTIEIMYRSSRSANKIQLYSITLKPSDDYSVIFNKDTVINGENNNSAQNTSNDYLYIDGKTTATIPVTVEVVADGYYDFYADVQFTDYGDTSYPYWFGNLSVTSGDKITTYIDQLSMPSDETLYIGKQGVTDLSSRYLRKAGTIILKAGTNTINFRVSSNRNNNDVKLYMASVKYRGENVFEDVDGIINVNTGMFDLKLNSGNVYEFPEADRIALRGKTSNPGQATFNVKTDSDRYLMSLDVTPHAYGNSNGDSFGYRVLVDGTVAVDTGAVYKATDYPTSQNGTVNIETPIVFDNSTTNEHTLAVQFYCNTSTVTYLNGITLTAYVPAFEIVPGEKLTVDANVNKAKEYNTEVNNNYPLTRGNISSSATYRVIVPEGAAGNYEVTYSFLVVQNDISFNNKIGYVATVDGTAYEVSVVEPASATERDYVASWTEPYTLSGVIPLKEGINDVVISMPSSTSHAVQVLKSISLVSYRPFVSSFTLNSTAFNNGDAVTATATIDDATKAPADTDVWVLIAKYDDSGRMISAELDKWNGTDASFDVSITADSLTDEIRAFLWTDDMVPLKTIPAVKKKQQ